MKRASIITVRRPARERTYVIDRRPIVVQQPEQWLTAQEVCGRLHCSRNTLYALERRGDLVPVRIEQLVRYRLSDVERVLRGETVA